MTDPVTIISIINASLGLAVKIGTVVNDLYTLSKRLKNAELTLKSIASESETIQAAWEGIEAWAKKQPVQHDEGRQRLLDRLSKSLLFEYWLLQAKQSGVERGLFHTAPAQDTRTSDRNDLLLQVIELPSSAEQTKLLIEDDEILKQCDETTWTIVDSSSSYSIKHPGARCSVESSESIYVKFDFEPQLMLGRAYGRSYNFLAKNMVKKKGKEALRNVNAELFVRGLDTAADDDHVSVISVSRYPGLNDSNEQLYPRINSILPSETSIRPDVRMDNGILSQSRHISNRVPSQARTGDEHLNEVTRIVNLGLWHRLTALNNSWEGVLGYISLQRVSGKNEVSIYRKASKVPVNSEADASLWDRYIISVRIEPSDSLHRGILNVDVVELEQLIVDSRITPTWHERRAPMLSSLPQLCNISSNETSRHLEEPIPTDELMEERTELIAKEAEAGPPEALRIGARAVRHDSPHLVTRESELEELDHMFRNILIYLLSKLGHRFIAELGEDGMQAINECKEDIIAVYCHKLRSMNSDIENSTTVYKDLT